MDVINSYLEELATTVNCNLEQVVLIFCIFVSFPIGLINYFIPFPFIRMVFGLSTGLFLQYFMYQGDMFHCIGASVFTFLYIKLVSRTKFSSPTFLLFLLMAHLTYLHFKQMLWTPGGWTLKDITLIHMVLVCKLTSVVFCYEDGMIPDDKFRNDYQKEKKIVNSPSLLEFFSYSFYVSTAIVGPYTEYADFRKFIYQEKEYSNIPMFKAIYCSLWELAYGGICMFMFLSYKDTYNPSFVATEEFGQFGFFYKLFYLNMAMNINQCKYYVAWKFITSVNIFNGLAYEPVEKTSIDGEQEIEHNFTRIQASVVSAAFFNPDIKEKISGWNHQIHLWLKYNVMLRFINNPWKVIRDNRVMLTYFVSAAWHGWYPAYYWVFFDFFIIDRICEVLKKDKFFERLEHSSYILQLIGMIVSLHACNYLGITFALLTIDKVLMYYKNMYFIPNIAMYLTYIYVVFLKGEYKSSARLEPGKKLDMTKIISHSVDEVKKTK